MSARRYSMNAAAKRCGVAWATLRKWCRLAGLEPNHAVSRTSPYQLTGAQLKRLCKRFRRRWRQQSLGVRWTQQALPGVELGAGEKVSHGSGV